MRRLRVLVLVGMLALFVFSAVPTFAASKTLIVDDSLGTPAACAGAKFKTIQEAVNAASSEATIKICPGTYDGGIAIKKNGLKLVGTPALEAYVVGGGFTGGFAIQASGVQIEGLDISGSFFGVIVGANGVILRNNNIHDNVDIGISIGRVKKGRVQGNTITSNGNGTLNTGGIVVEGASDFELVSNLVNSNRAVGILMRNVKGFHLLTNQASGNALQGIEFCSSKGNLAEQNAAVGNGRDGALVDDPDSSFCEDGAPSSMNNTFKRNILQNNLTFDANDASKGDKTAGTANIWTANQCVKDSPDGLC